MERLQKAIAASGYASRRKAEELILQGRVKVNDAIVTTLGTKVKKGDYIEVDGKQIVGENKVYYVFYKPKGCVCTLKDEFNRTKVTDFFTESKERVYPVGRLDFDTTGVLFMTNDGEFANLIMHPRNHLEKIYEVSITGLITGESLHMLEKGLYIDGTKTLPCKIKVTNKDVEHKTTVLQIKLYEGKNRQVRKMFESVGHRVKRLHRISVGGINTKGLVPGSYRILKPQEVKNIRKLVQ